MSKEPGELVLDHVGMESENFIEGYAVSGPLERPFRAYCGSVEWHCLLIRTRHS
jgi:hypothetical protein